MDGPILRIVKKHTRIKRMIGVHSIKKQAFICKRSFYYYYIAHCVFLREIEWQCCSAKKASGVCSRLFHEIIMALAYKYERDQGAGGGI